MLSYNHGYHAGNHADVLKHICWAIAIEYLKKKPKPFTLFDTHGGAGEYRLDSDQAIKTQEYLTGISKLAGQAVSSAAASAYLAVCKPLWDRQIYPGSPSLASELIREDDRLVVMEMHPGEAERLQAVMGSKRNSNNIAVHYRDGFEGLMAMVPPRLNRGAILIDPPYERLDEYQSVLTLVSGVLKKWRNAQIIVWYPLLSKRAGEKSGASENMCNDISLISVPVLTAELIVNSKDDDSGMYGSGMCIVNPSWNMDKEIAEALSDITPALGDTVSSSVKWLRKE